MPFSGFILQRAFVIPALINPADCGVLCVKLAGNLPVRVAARYSLTHCCLLAGTRLTSYLAISLISVPNLRCSGILL